jgi:hypothetical protein
MRSIRDAGFLECVPHILHGPGRLGCPCSRRWSRGKAWAKDENPVKCTLSSFVRLCYQIQSLPFHSHPDHEGFESAAVERAVSQSRSDLLGDLAFVVAVGSTWLKSTDHRDVSTCLKLLKSLASGSPDHHDPCLSLCHLLMSSGGAGSYFQATMCRML